MFKPAGTIVDAVLLEHQADEVLCPSLPKPVNLRRQANRVRQKTRPADPSDLNFDIENDHIPEHFLKGDVRVGDHRHLIFATAHMLSLLSRARRWYVDATFKVIRPPFHQLFSIHAFIKADGEIKQVPLVFVLMSSRRRPDYSKVLKAILDVLPAVPAVQEIVADFEASVWRAVSSVLPTTTMRGCVFHWTQAIWRHVQELGLSTAYQQDEGTYHYIRQLMALPFLPHEHIHSTFNNLASCATTHALQELIIYIRNTWIESSIWPVESWSVFNQSVRTNNDVEGWHRRLNHRANRGQLPLYLLIGLLHDESRLASLYVRLVSEGKLKRHQKKTYANLQAKLQTYWQEFINGERSTKRLLRACARLHGPIIN